MMMMMVMMMMMMMMMPSKVVSVVIASYKEEHALSVNAVTPTPGGYGDVDSDKQCSDPVHTEWHPTSVNAVTPVQVDYGNAGNVKQAVQSDCSSCSADCSSAEFSNAGISFADRIAARSAVRTAVLKIRRRRLFLSAEHEGILADAAAAASSSS